MADKLTFVIPGKPEYITMDCNDLYYRLRL